MLEKEKCKPVRWLRLSFVLTGMVTVSFPEGTYRYVLLEVIHVKKDLQHPLAAPGTGDHGVSFSWWMANMSPSWGNLVPARPPA
jgi:hypothetical protein